MKKQLKDLTLLSKFLFDQTMELPEAPVLKEFMNVSAG